MGYDAIKTFIFKSESGVSLRASGWESEGEVRAENWSRPSRNRNVQEHSSEPKVRYVKRLRVAALAAEKAVLAAEQERSVGADAGQPQK